MNQPSLKDMITVASKAADDIFKGSGQLLPMYHTILSNGKHVLMLSPMASDKDEAVAAMKQLFEQERVEAYCFMTEAWILSTPIERAPDLVKIAREGLKHHPDRREAVMFTAENRSGDQQTATRFILRPEHGKPTLSPLVIDDMNPLYSVGRMVGLLTPRKRNSDA